MIELLNGLCHTFPMNQDFSKRMAIVVDHDLPSWQVLNTVGHIAAFLGNKMPDAFDTGEYFVSRDNIDHPRNSQYPIIIFSAKASELKKLIKPVRDSGLLYIGFVPEMIEMNDDGELAKAIQNKLDEEVEYCGIGIFGENERVKALVKKFSLWK